MYRQIDKLNVLPNGRPRRVTTAPKEWLLEYQSRRPWAYQDELAIALEEECDITVRQPTVCRHLKENKISREWGQRITNMQNPELRAGWQAFMLDVTAGFTE